MKKIILWLFIIIGVLFGLVIGKPIGKKIATNDHYANINKEINKDLPKMIDDITRLDHIKASKYNYTYHYTIIDYNITGLYFKMLKLKVTNNVCNQYKYDIEKGTTYTYQYSTNNGYKEFEINTVECKATISKELDIKGLNEEVKNEVNQ